MIFKQIGLTKKAQIKFFVSINLYTYKNAYRPSPKINNSCLKHDVRARASLEISLKLNFSTPTKFYSVKIVSTRKLYVLVIASCPSSKHINGT